jgi:hypothetical protein
VVVLRKGKKGVEVLGGREGNEIELSLDVFSHDFKNRRKLIN